MSVDADRGDRDLEAEFASSVAGRFGIPVDAVCVGCGQTRVSGKYRPKLYYLTQEKEELFMVIYLHILY